MHTQVAIIMAIVTAVALVTIAINLGPTASTREKRALKWLSAAGPLIAIAGLAVAIQQLALSRQSGERQDRAYVFVSQIEVQIQPGVEATVDFRQKNYGRTAAFDVRGSSTCRLYDWPATFGPYAGASGEPKNRSTLPPGDDIATTVKCQEVITAQDAEQLSQGKKALIVIGDVIYRDIFQNSHRYIFRRMVGGHVGFRGNYMATTPVDDESD